jgi:hypothetical protein
LTEKPVISGDTHVFDGPLLDILTANISTLASVYHKPPENFVKGGHHLKFKRDGFGETKVKISLCAGSFRICCFLLLCRMRTPIRIQVRLMIPLKVEAEVCVGSSVMQLDGVGELQVGFEHSE